MEYIENIVCAIDLRLIVFRLTNDFIVLSLLDNACSLRQEEPFWLLLDLPASFSLRPDHKVSIGTVVLESPKDRYGH